MATSARETEARPIPWNKGKLIGRKHPLKVKDIRVIRVRPRMARHERELALLNLAVDSKRRGRDVALGGRVTSRAMLMQPMQPRESSSRAVRNHRAKRRRGRPETGMNLTA